MAVAESRSGNIAIPSSLRGFSPDYAMIEMSLVTSEYGISIIIWPGKNPQSLEEYGSPSFAGLVLSFFLSWVPKTQPNH